MTLNARLTIQVTLFTDTSKFNCHQNLKDYRGLLFIPSFYTHEHGVQRFDPNPGNPHSLDPLRPHAFEEQVLLRPSCLTFWLG